MDTPLRFRQVHLDFHTSEAIAKVAQEFDPAQFARTLDDARVNSVTVFARCHHGWLYYASKAFPHRVHPSLTNPNLLAQQIDACHQRGIRAPIYLTVQWDQVTSQEHPDWCVIGPDGKLRGTPPYEAGFYRFLCVNTPYRDYLKAITREVLETFKTDGLFFDITQVVDCSCAHCKADMAAQGYNAADAGQRKAFSNKMMREWKQEMTAFVRQYNKDCTVFYNAGHVGLRDRDDLSADAYSHWELESLPSGGWGYLHFPISVRYARKMGKPYLGMTGKFHTSWGDFHSYKNLPALQYECFQMLAMGACCSVGDQLPPDGKLCPTTYKLIGQVYREVEQKEPWCADVAPQTDIAVLTAEEFAGKGGHEIPAMQGVTRLLQESRHQFDLVDSNMDFAPYRVLILPDEIPVSAPLARKIDRFLAGGGAVIASYKSGLNEAGDAFALKALGVKLKGDAPFSPDFLVPAGTIGKGLEPVEHVMYRKGLEVSTVGKAQALAHVNVPYFNRTWEHFCSHRHTPSAGKVGYPGVVRNGQAVYFAHPIFSQYGDNSPRWCKQLVLNALELLLPQPLVRMDAPSTAQATLNDQPGHKRQVLHLLHYVPERRGQFDVIEDIIPLLEVHVSVRADRKIKKVTCVPEGVELPFRTRAGRVEFTVPGIAGHQMVELKY